MRQNSKNVTLRLISGGLETVVLQCSTGTLLQALLASIGFGANAIYIHSTLVQAVTVLTILLASRWADHGDLIKRNAFVWGFHGVMFLGYLPICMLHQANIFTYCLLMAVSILQSITNGLNTVCTYKLPYYIYEGNSYGFVSAVIGIVSNVLSFFIGLLMSYLSSRYAYAQLMLVAMLVSFGFSVVASILRSRFKKLQSDIQKTPQQKKDVPMRDILLHPTFVKLLPANLTRGIANGATAVFAVIASTNLGYSESVVSAIVSVSSVAMLISCGIMMVSNGHISPRILIFMGSIGMLGLPFLLIPNQPALFLLLVGIILFGRNLVDVAVPILLVKAVPAQIAGPYHAWRMVIHNGGTLLATVLATMMPMHALLIVAAACQLYSGFVYWHSQMLRRV